MSERGRDALNDEIYKAIKHVVGGFEMDYSEVAGVLDTIKFEVLATGAAKKKEDKEDADG